MCKNQLFARLIAVLSLLLTGCADGAMRHGGTVVAEVGDAKLTSAMVPAEVFAYGGQDSLTLLRAYAERWATQQAVYQCDALRAPVRILKVGWKITAKP